MLRKTVLSLKSPTGAFIAPLRCANANLFNKVQEKLAKNKKAPARHKAEESYYITTMADEEKASADTTLTCRGLCCACGPGICNRTGTNRAFHAVFRAIRAGLLPKCGKICYP